MLDVIIGMGEGVGISANNLFKVLCGTGVFKFSGFSSYLEIFPESVEDLTPALQRIPSTVTLSKKYGLAFRTSSSSVSTTGVFVKQHFLFYGLYNYDNVQIDAGSFMGRMEVRNENGVLITDNGVAWPDGTYPPDAKNRTGLTGLHAAPIASNNEFADLSGVDPNKEVEMIGAERGAGVQYALEKEE